MIWKDLSITKKLGSSFGFVILLLLIIATVSWVGLRQLSGEITISSYYSELKALTLHREIDHLNWKSKVIIYLASENDKPLKVKVDDHACKLGKFLFGEERKKAEQVLPELALLFKELERPHRDLHDSAREIQQSVTNNDGDREEAREIYNTKSRSSIKQVQKVLHKIAEEIDSHANSSNEQLSKDAKRDQNLIIILSGLAIVLATVFGFFISRLISSTLNQAVTLADHLAEGDLTTRLKLDQKDEFGMLAKSLNKMSTKLNTMIGNMNKEMLSLTSTSNELNTIAIDMKDSNEAVSGQAANVASATQELSSNMYTVAAASEQASTNVNIVASASEEVSSSIGEVDAKTREARSITEDAVALAGSSSQKVDALGEAADKISKVTQVITEISEQTNLLALNATIEAARAGEAGKGFAVVANEIKELAKQTAEATGEIRSSIEAMQSSTNETVGEIRQITSVINRVDEIVAAIAASVAEQTATTTEITENIMQAAQGISEVNENVAQTSTASSEIAENIDMVSSMTGDLSQTGKDVEGSATDLVRIATELKDMIETFTIDGLAYEKTAGNRPGTQVSGRRLIRWSSSLKVNISVIDEQHKKLVGMINDLHRAMKAGSSVSEAGAILDRLVDYTADHFALEEQLFEKHGYPEYEAHKQHHEKLVDQVVKFQKEFKSGQAALSVELMDFLKDWLVNHIKGVDKKYVPFLREKGVK
ncbi:MAG: bacteriohemerythrin [Thermodesulfobacteriota bacterium]